jgi:hypothetical protein
MLLGFFGRDRVPRMRPNERCLLFSRHVRLYPIATEERTPQNRREVPRTELTSGEAGRGSSRIRPA